MKMFQNTETLPVLLMNYLQSREQKWYRVSTAFLLKDRNCDICLKTKLTRAFCRRRAGTVVPRAEIFGDLITADHKVLSEGSESRNIRRCAVVVHKATPRKGRVVPTLLTSRFSCCNLDWGFRFGHISSIFLSAARRTRRGTDFRLLGVQYHVIEKPFRNDERICYLFSRFHFLSRHESKDRNLVYRPLSGFINQIEASLLVHALQLPLHLQRHGVSSSPMETMFASAPSKLSRSASQKPHPSRLSPSVVLLVEHSQ